MRSEFISNINAEDYHNVVYPLVVNEDYVFQPNLQGDLSIVLNSEKVRPLPAQPEQVISQPKHPLQGEFHFPRPIKIIK